MNDPSQGNNQREESDRRDDDENDINNLKQRRGALRQRITKLHRRAVGNKEINLTLAEQDIMFTALEDYDDAIGDGDSSYYIKLGEIENRIKRDLLAINQTIVAPPPPPPEPLSLSSLEIQSQLQSQSQSRSQTNYGPDRDVFKMEPFDGSPSKYGIFERKFERTYENGDYPDHAQITAFIRLLPREAKNYVDHLADDPDGLTKAKAFMKKHYNAPYQVQKDVERQLNELTKLSENTPAHLLQLTIASIKKALAALQSCEAGELYINGTFFHYVATKLPHQICLDYRRKYKKEDGALLVEFAEKEIDDMIDAWIMSNNQLIQPKIQTKPKQLMNRVRGPTSVGAISTTASTSNAPSACLLCKDSSHRTIGCTSGTPQERKDKARELKLCYRCLRSGHRIELCKSTYKCRCGRSHSSVICTSSTSNNHTNGHSSSPITGVAAIDTNEGEEERSESTTTIGAISTMQVNSTISSGNNWPPGTYYSTVMVNLKGSSGVTRKARVLIDGGGGTSMIAANLADELKLERSNTNELFGGAGGTVFKSDSTVQVTLEALDESSNISMECAVVKRISFSAAAFPQETIEYAKTCGYPICDISRDEVSKYPIELLVGLDYTGKVLVSPPYQINNQLTAWETIFGWVVSGKVRANPTVWQHPTYCGFISTDIYDEKNYNQLPSAPQPQNKSDPIAVEYVTNFINNKVNLINGKYVVELPWIEPVHIGDNRDVAITRLNRLIPSLKKREVYDDYEKTMQEYITHYAEPIPTTSAMSDRIYYFPHHAVIRMDKTTTKLRIVFDGSSSAPGQCSLNDALFKGFVQWNLLNALIRFRMGNVVMISDIEKAYLRVTVATKDRDSFRFLWFDEDGKIKDYRFTVVPFGTSTSPFLLYAVMEDLFKRFANEYSDIIPLIQKCFYVDDLILTLPSTSPEEIDHIRRRIIELFTQCDMNIRKWVTNDPQLLNQWTNDQPPTTVKVLGHVWNPSTDQFSPLVNSDMKLCNGLITKRIVSSFIAGIYDPLGLIVPYVVQLRSAIRNLWHNHYDWDDVVDGKEAERIRSLMLDAEQVKLITLPRNVLNGKGENSELIIFCDASKLAYGAAAYIRNRDTGSMSLLMAKAKLSSMTKTIPSLELDALFSARDLAIYLCSQYSFTHVWILSDSLLNLQRLEKHPNKMVPALAVRLSKLKTGLVATFRHVTTKQNSADLLSRGCTMSQLLKEQAWWTGHPLEEESKFEMEPIAYQFSISIEQHCNCITIKYADMIAQYRIKAQSLSADERAIFTDDILDDQLPILLLLKDIQREHFGDEIEDISNNHHLPTRLVSHQHTKYRISNPQSLLRAFDCFLDDNGLLRIRSRLENHPNFTYDEKYPIVLPGNCPATTRIVEHVHEQMMHSGIERINSALKERYKIIGAKRLVKRVQRTCDYCIKERAKTSNPNYGPLPQFRLTDSVAPFTNTGLDLFGPFKLPAENEQKRYGIIFSCANTRAIHLELLLNMTATEVLEAIRRFVARRGLPKLWYSDNGTQLLKVRKNLRTLMTEVQELQPDLELRFAWLTQTVGSPWRGGFFERINRSIKRAFNSQTIGRKKISDTQLTTILYEIEGKINDRPLFKYEDKLITPSMFLVGKPLSQLPQLGNNDARQVTRSTSLIDNYVKSQRLTRALWAMWRDGYLKDLRLFYENPQLNGRPFDFKVGDKVMIKSNLPTTSWPIGTIEEVFVGTDGIARTFNVKSRIRGQEEVKPRSIQTLIPLECTMEQSD